MVQGQFEANRTRRVDEGPRRLERHRRRSQVRPRRLARPTCSPRTLHSSNLTFSLSPGWSFVETEGWRPDLIAAWAVDSAAPSADASVCVGADEGMRSFWLAFLSVLTVRACRRLDVHHRHVDASPAGRTDVRWLGDPSTTVGEACVPRGCGAVSLTSALASAFVWYSFRGVNECLFSLIGTLHAFSPVGTA